MREMIPQLYAGVGRGLLILWFRGYFLIIRKVLFISGLQKQLKIRGLLSRRFFFLIRSLSLSGRLNGSLTPVWHV
jgi:hypothetical protein